MTDQLGGPMKIYMYITIPGLELAVLSIHTLISQGAQFYHKSVNAYQIHTELVRKEGFEKIQKVSHTFY